MHLITKGYYKTLLSGQLLLIVWFLMIQGSSYAQFGGDYTVDINYTPEQLVQEILIGNGIETTNITLKGASISKGKFWGESNIGIDEGVILTSGDARKSKGPNNQGNAGTDNNTSGDADLNQLGGGNTHDACVLEFDFVPQSNTVEFRYVFASEEYLEYVGSINDVFGFFISGPDIYGPFSNEAINIARLPGFPGDIVSINSVNNVTNSQYYVNNPQGSNTTIQYDGFTTVLTARSFVVPCQTYHIKLAIADMVDGILDSGVFLEANSFTSVGLGASVGFTHTEVDTAVEGCNSASVKFKLFQITPVDYIIDLEITGTAENGVDYLNIPNQLIIPQGEDSVVLVIDPIEDMMPEDLTETVNLIYNSSLCGTIMDTITMYIKDLQPFSSYASPGMTINCEDTITLRASGDGGQVPYYYNWSTGETTDTIVVSPPNPIVYTVQISDVCGQSETQTISINVVGPDAVASDDVSLCIGNSTPLTVDGGTSWLWEADPPDASLVGQETLQNIIVTPIVTTDYTITVFDECGNQDVDYVTVSVGELTADAGDDITICTDQSTTLTAGPSGNLTYTWTENGIPYGTGQTITVTPTADATYCVTVTDNLCTTSISTDCIEVFVTDMTVSATSDVSEICIGEPVELTASNNPSSGSGIYTWSDGTNTYSGQTITVFPDITTNYTVTIDDGCVKESLPVTVTVHPLPIVTATAAASSICPDEFVTLNAGGAMSYSWMANPSDPSLTGQEILDAPSVSPVSNTIYTVTGTDINGCVNTDEISITVKPRMYADFEVPAAVCEGDNITINYTGNGNSAATYDWSFDGGNTIPGSGQGPHQISWGTMGTKTITLIVTQNSCVSDQVIQTVEVNPTPVADFSQGITKGCVPLTVDFTNESTNTTPDATYLWDLGSAGSVTDASHSFEFTQPGTYDVSLTVSNPGCSDQMTVPLLVEAWPVPVADFTADPLKVSLKNPVITFNSTTPAGNLTYEWLTGDGNTYTVPDFTHTYVDSGVYKVMMTIVNEFGCQDSTSQMITITPKYMIKVPTAFTPNNDGRNDEFRIIGNGVQKFRITIYNRWGSLIFESSDINHSWDGKINGQQALPGTYVYHTYFMDDNNEVSEQTGSFTLIK